MLLPVASSFAFPDLAYEQQRFSNMTNPGQLMTDRGMLLKDN
jgi:hypothetical protein